MQLTKVILSTYLPFGITVMRSDGKTCVMTSATILDHFRGKNDRPARTIEKLFLRPISDINKDISHEGKMVRGSSICKTEYEKSAWEGEEWDEFVERYWGSLEMIPHNRWIRLAELKFDLFDLHEEELAEVL